MQARSLYFQKIADDQGTGLCVIGSKWTSEKTVTIKWTKLMLFSRLLTFFNVSQANIN